MATANTIEREIEEMVARIVEKFDPELIYLFGSRARGDATRDSDIDLLVVTEVESTKRETATQIRLALNDFPTPKDIVVRSPVESAECKDVIGGIEYPATHEGKLLYARL